MGFWESYSIGRKQGMGGVLAERSREKDIEKEKKALGDSYTRVAGRDDRGRFVKLERITERRRKRISSRGKL